MLLDAAVTPLLDDGLGEQAATNVVSLLSLRNGFVERRERRDGHFGRQSKCRNVGS